MPLSTSEKDFWISPKYTASDWEELRLDSGDEHAWSRATDMVEDRIKGRFVRWIDSVVGQRFSGFVVIALDCLLIETLVGFMTGKASEGPDAFLTGELTDSVTLKFTKEEAESFRNNVRNGIVHDAETRCGWVVRPGKSTGNILTQDGSRISLNRSAFHSAVSRELDAWLAKVRAGDGKLRQKMKRRMEEIIERHGEAVQ